MIKDALFNAYIGGLHSEVAKRTEAVATGVHADLYTLGRAQGALDGLKEALNILERVSEEQDERSRKL